MAHFKSVKSNLPFSSSYKVRGSPRISKRSRSADPSNQFYPKMAHSKSEKINRPFPRSYTVRGSPRIFVTYSFCPRFGRSRAGCPWKQCYFFFIWNICSSDNGIKFNFWDFSNFGFFGIFEIYSRFGRFHPI